MAVATAIYRGEFKNLNLTAAGRPKPCKPPDRRAKISAKKI